MFLLFLSQAYLYFRPAEIPTIHGIGAEKTKQLLEIIVEMGLFQHQFWLVNNLVGNNTVSINLITGRRNTLQQDIYYSRSLANTSSISIAPGGRTSQNN